MPVNDIHGGEISTETASLIKQMEAEAQRPEVIPNPELSGDEPALTGLQVGDDKFAVPQGTEVVANPTLAGTESDLTGLQVGETKYTVPQGTEVIANPASTGVESELARLQVGERVYKIPGGGGQLIGLLKDKFTSASFSMEHPVLKLTVYKDSLTSYTVENGNYVLLIYPGPQATSSLFYPAGEEIPEDAHAIQISVVDGEIVLEGGESGSVSTCPFDLNPSDSCFMLYSSDSTPGYSIANATDVTGIAIGAEYVQAE